MKTFKTFVESEATMIDEYIMWIDNTEKFYKQKMEMVKNLKRKIDRGKYDHKKSVKLWMYLVDAATKDYHGGGRQQVPKSLRLKVAEKLADRELANIEDGVY